jgi:DNA (cytosine-5)-methyltransferase 1
MLDFVNMPINPETPRLFNVISTFAGCGGSSLGYKWAGGKVLAAVEWDENAVATYGFNHKDTPVLYRDIATVTTEELLHLTGLQSGELDIFDGSPPCQGFSTNGERQFDDPRNGLFKEYVRLLRGLQPKVFVMENVSGMVKGYMKHIFALAMRELKASGYQVKCQLMNAMYFGVPQSRQRVIFIGVRNDLHLQPSHPVAQTKATGMIPAPETRSEAQRYTPHQVEASIAHRARHEAKGNGFGYVELRAGYPTCTLTSKVSLSEKFVHTPTAPRFIENGIHWLPSPIELNRIGSFPDAFQFVGSYRDQWMRIGNSVPPKFMYHIAHHIYTNILSKITQTAQLLERIEEPSHV